MKAPGQVRVGTCRFEGSKRIDPSFPGFTKIVCLTASTKYGMLSPYCLTVRVKFSKDLFPALVADNQGHDEEFDCLMENAYQFSKVFPGVNETTETRSRFDRTVIWQWPAQVHLTAPPPTADNPNPIPMVTTNYFQWRKAGMIAKEPIRYPVGKKNMASCAFSLLQTEDGKVSPIPLNYIEARKQIYLPAYAKSAKAHPEFAKLQQRLLDGENLLIIEVDGPQARSLPYYKEKYGVGDDFIQNDTILITPRHLEIMLNDSTERFGHGYCLSGSLLGIY